MCEPGGTDHLDHHLGVPAAPPPGDRLQALPGTAHQHVLGQLATLPIKHIWYLCRDIFDNDIL